MTRSDRGPTDRIDLQPRRDAQQRAPTAVIALGNPLLSDEGVGTKVLQRLAAGSRRFPNTDFLDLGTAGFELLHAMAERETVLVVDCAFMGAQPGTMRRFAPQEVRSVKLATDVSAHRSDVLQIVELLETLGQAPGSIWIYGIEPQTIEPGEQLSDVLSDRLDQYAQTVADDLEQLRCHA